MFKNFNDKCAIFGASYKPAATKTTAGVLNLKDEKTCQIIKSFKKKNKKTFLIIYCHSGLELFEFPLLQDELIYRKFIESGADLVIGSHPHRVQGIEKYQKKYIFIR